MSFRIFALAGAAAVLLAIPLPSDVSAQPAPSVEVGPGGVRVHDRYESRRRDERRHERYESRGRERGCKTVIIREPRPGGGERIIKRRECD